MAGRVPARLTSAEGRKFGLTVGLAFGVLAALSWWREHTVPMYVFGTVSVLLLLAAAVVPGRLGPFQRAWMGLAHLISLVTTPIFMALVYFLAIAPVGLLMRLFGRNPLKHKPEDGSLWLARSDSRGDMTHQF